MKRKNFLTILISIVVIIVLAIIAFLIISFWKGEQGSTQDSGFSLFPNRGGSSVVETPGTTSEDEDEIISEDTETGQKIPRLRRLADFPVVALAAYSRPEKIVIERIVESKEKTSDESTDQEGIIDITIKPEKIIEIIDIDQLYARYIKQEDGAVFTSKIANTLMQTQTTIGNIPYAGDAVVGNNGNDIIFRFFNDRSQKIETFLGTIKEDIIPDSVCAIPFPSTVTTESDEATITLLQEFLIYDLEKDATSDGKFGASTKQELRDFQKKENLTVTGLADALTTSTINNICTSVAEKRIAAKNPKVLNGVFLPENITALSLSPSGEDVIYFVKRELETIVTTLNFDTQSLKQVFTSPFSEWTPYWTGDTRVSLHTKPSGLVEGYLYTLDTEDGNLRKITSGITGLGGMLNSNQDKAFLSGASGTITNKILDINTGVKSDVSFKTLPEKCTWSKDSVILYCAVPQSIPTGLYPDDWYKGKVTFTDSIWSLNTATGETREIINLLTEGGESFDVIKMSLEENELFMFFINKRTGEPWVLEL